MTLIAAAQEYEIEFIYAISPGLDITFSNPKEVSTLKRKLDQVSFIPVEFSFIIRESLINLSEFQVFCYNY